MATQYYILSLKWSNPYSLLWWGPDSAGYTAVLDQAGKYAETEALTICLNDGTDTLAIPCSIAERFAERVVRAESKSEVVKAVLADRKPSAKAGEKCERCEGSGWLWPHQVGDHETDQRYTCPDCGGSQKTAERI